MIRTSDTFEHLILKKFFEDRNYFTQVFPYFKTEYLEGIHEKFIADAIIQYFKDYKEPPTYDSVQILVEENKANPRPSETSGVLLERIKNKSFDVPNFKFLIDKTETHFQYMELWHATVKASLMLGDKEKIDERFKLIKIFQDAVAVKIRKEKNTLYLSDESLEDQYNWLHNPESHYPLPEWDIMNEMLGGGPSKREMYMMVACSGVGKSTWLCNVARQYYTSGLNVMYVSLESTADRLKSRVDSALTLLTENELKLLSKEEYITTMVSKRKEGNSFFLHRPPGGKTSSVHIGLMMDEHKNLHGVDIDVVIVDYVSLLKSATIRDRSDSYSYFGSIAKELKDLADERNVVMFTAAQVNRSAYTTKGDYEEAAISESMQYLHHVEWMAALIENDDLEMAGRQEIKVFKNRNGERGSKFGRWAMNADKPHQILSEIPKTFQRESPPEQLSAPRSHRPKSEDKEFKKEIRKETKEYLSLQTDPGAIEEYSPDLDTNHWE